MQTLHPPPVHVLLSVQYRGGLHVSPSLRLGVAEKRGMRARSITFGSGFLMMMRLRKGSGVVSRGGCMSLS